MTKWKYLLAYAAPASAIAGLYFKGWAAPGAMYIGFVLIPLIEGLFFNKMKRPAKPESIHESPVLFNLFLYLNLPLLYFIENGLKNILLFFIICIRSNILLV